MLSMHPRADSHRSRVLGLIAHLRSPSWGVNTHLRICVRGLMSKVPPTQCNVVIASEGQFPSEPHPGTNVHLRSLQHDVVIASQG